jgi:hypothetical protein
MERDDDFSDEWSSDEEEENGASPVKLVSTTTQQVAEWFAERSKYIPLRLSLKERKLLRLLEAAANVSEYTDKVDILTWKSKTQRIHTQLQDICAILLGLVVATDYKTGQAMIADKSFKDNEEFFQRIFEIGRRHKIMNPGFFFLFLFQFSFLFSFDFVFSLFFSSKKNRKNENGIWKVDLFASRLGCTRNSTSSGVPIGEGHCHCAFLLERKTMPRPPRRPIDAHGHCGDY